MRPTAFGVRAPRTRSSHCAQSTLQREFIDWDRHPHDHHPFPHFPHLPSQWLQCQDNGSNVCRVLRRKSNHFARNVKESRAQEPPLPPRREGQEVECLPQRGSWRRLLPRTGNVTTSPRIQSSKFLPLEPFPLQDPVLTQCLPQRGSSRRLLPQMGRGGTRERRRPWSTRANKGWNAVYYCTFL